MGGGAMSMRWWKLVTIAGCAFVCIVTLLLWERSSNPMHRRFFHSRQPRRHPVAFSLWSDPAVVERWMPCSWWWGVPRRPRIDNTTTNGYLVVACVGGLNQMRRDFCKGVSIARLLNATLLLPPRFETSPYWNDSSVFAEIFDVDFFLETVRGWVDVARELPVSMSGREPVAITCPKRRGGNNPYDYTKSLLPQLLQHKLLLLRPSASQRPDRNPSFAKRARCQACYRSLRLVSTLQETGEAILRELPSPFASLHLRFEPDMIAYSRCRYNNLSHVSMAAIERVRGVRQTVLGESAEALWRRKGKCPLTPLETRFILQALHIPASTPIYLAAGSELLLELHELTATYSRVFQKSDFLRPDRLEALKGTSRAAIDWFVSLHADVYIATFVGNMDKMVVTDRILAGKQRNLVLDRRSFAEAKWQGKHEAEISELMLKNHRQQVVFGYGLPVSDCLCKA